MQHLMKSMSEALVMYCLRNMPFFFPYEQLLWLSLFYYLLGCTIKQHPINVTEPGLYVYICVLYVLGIAQIPVPLFLEKFHFNIELLFRIKPTNFYCILPCSSTKTLPDLNYHFA